MNRREVDYSRPYQSDDGRPLSQKTTLNALEAIWKEYDNRLKTAYAQKQEFGLTKNEDAKNFLRREVYVLGIALKRNPPSWSLSDFIASTRMHKSTRVSALEGQVFHALLMGVYEEDSTISRQERWSMAKELEYAFAHRVPPKLLCGFLLQSGGRKHLLKKLETGFKEPAFRKPTADVS